MRLFISIAIYLIGVSAAFAEMPPKRFDYVPAVHVIKHKVAYGQAAAKCNQIYMRRFGERYPSKPRFGCTIFEDGRRPEIVFSYDPTGRDKLMASNVLRHEYAHVNGWNSSHSN